MIKMTPPILYLVRVSHYIALNPKALSPITLIPHKFGEQVLAEIKAANPIPIVPKVPASSFLLG
jgi:hypothetical protein